jgi:hypothetical protein
MTPDEAAKALSEARATAERSAAAAGYERMSANLFLWGGIWILVNVGGLLRLPHGSILFPALMGLGLAGSLILARRGATKAARKEHLMRTALIAVAVLLFVLGLLVVAPSGSLIQVEAVVCLAIGAVYVAAGASLGLRLAVVGVVQIAATVVGWIYARDHFFLWMAVVGGGGLVVGGLWLRKV